MKGNSHGVAAGHFRHAAAGLLAATTITLTAAGAAAADPPNFGHDWNGGPPHGVSAGPPHEFPGGPPQGVPSGPPSPTLPEETAVPAGCTSTLTGTITGGVVVPSGQRDCLVQAQVEGGATVTPGAGIVVQDSRVDGGVRAAGANYVRVCDSIVNGPIAAYGGTKYVMIGDADDDGTPACATNYVHGPVALIHNQAGVELGGDSIAGPVFLIGNQGPAFEGTDVGAEVEANHISGPLVCSCNSPEPTNDGLPNVVAGPEWGQCKGF
jgi:hypothetical protein